MQTPLLLFCVEVVSGIVLSRRFVLKYTFKNL